MNFYSLWNKDHNITVAFFFAHSLEEAADLILNRLGIDRHTIVVYTNKDRPSERADFNKYQICTEIVNPKSGDIIYV